MWYNVFVKDFLKMENIDSKKLPSIFALTREAIQMYWANFRRYLSFALIPVFGALLIAIAFTVAFFGLLIAQSFSFNTTTGFFLTLLSLAVVILFILAAVIVQIWTPAAFLVNIRDGNRNTILESFKNSRQFIRPSLISSLMGVASSFGAAMALFLPATILFALLVNFLPGLLRYTSILGVELATIIVAVLGLLLILPGLVVAIWLTFVIFIIVFGNETVASFQLLGRSRELMRGYWWPVVGRLAFIGLISGLISFIFGLAVEALGPSYSLLLNLLFFILAPFFVCYTYLLYLNLVQAKGAIEESKINKSATQLRRLAWYGVIVSVVFIILPLFLNTWL